MNKHYDYIIAGAGAAGLSLAWKLMQSKLSQKHVLIVDSNLQPQHDKTWCFWDAGTPPFADIIHQQWKQVEIGTLNGRVTQQLQEYPYYCLRSVDFQKKILDSLGGHPNVDLLEDDIEDLRGNQQKAILHTSEDSYSADYIFQSCFSPWDDNQQDNPDYPLLQHFLGWEIELNQAVFDESSFILMDFDETFTDGLAFIYLLPWSQESALIEYTIFSPKLASKDKYEEMLSLYLNHRYNLQPIDYNIYRKEYGEIPMQDRPVKSCYAPRIINLGTVGGVTKASTGYTFQRIQKQTEALVKGLRNNGKPTAYSPSKWRYKAYDLWLLQIIHDHPKDAIHVFSDLLERNSMDDIFRFLGEETSFIQDLKIMSSVPYLPFLRAIWKTRNRIRQI